MTTTTPLIDRPRRAPDPNLEQWQVVLDEVMNFLGISDAELGEALGLSRQSIHGRRTGKFKSISVKELEATADAIGIPVQLFHGPSKEAIEWILEKYSTHFPCNACSGDYFCPKHNDKVAPILEAWKEAWRVYNDEGVTLAQAAKQLGIREDTLVDRLLAYSRFQNR